MVLATDDGVHSLVTIGHWCLLLLHLVSKTNESVKEDNVNDRTDKSGKKVCCHTWEGEERGGGCDYR